MKENRRRRRHASEWSGLLEQWSRSGEPAERFAARLGVKVATLSRWQKQVNAGKTSPKSAGPSLPEGRVSQSLFAPVQVVSAPRRRGGGLVEVVTREGYVVRVHGLVDAETLSAVLGALEPC
jgi:hypothetical protein